MFPLEFTGRELGLLSVAAKTRGSSLVVVGNSGFLKEITTGDLELLSKCSDKSVFLWCSMECSIALESWWGIQGSP